MSSIQIPAGVRNIVINQVEPAKPLKQLQADENYVDDKKGNRELPEDLQKALKELLTHYGTEVDKVARRAEVVDARRQRFYDRGYQYIYYNAGSYVFLPITAGVVMSVGSDNVSMPRYCQVYNIYKPYRRNFAATLTQNPPGVKFEAKDPTSSVDIKVADLADKYSKHFDSVNEPKKLQAKMARLFWTDGRVVARTIHEKNPEKFGTYQDEQQEKDFQEDTSQAEEAALIGQEDELPKALAADAGADKMPLDGAGAETEEDEEAAEKAEMEASEKDARGEEVTRLYGVLEAKCFPITADEQDELAGVILSDDPDVNKAKDKYWWIADKIKPGQVSMGESAFERNARLGVLQGLRMWAQSADGYAHLTERQIMYLRPAAFRHNKTLRKRLKKVFPNGVCATFVSGEYAQADNVSLDDELKVDFPLDGDGMNRPSWGKDHVPVQDAYNNYRNMRQEFHDYCIPVTVYDTAVIDPNSLKEKVSQPGEWWAVMNPNPTVTLGNYFFTTETITVPADLIEAEQDLRDALSQLITGVQSALFGGNLSAGKEADRVGVYQMAREQAMGVMAMPWGVMQWMFAGMKYQAVLAAARNRRQEESLTVQVKRRYGKAKPVSVSIGDLQKGNFRAVPSTDSSFPVTRQMRKEALKELVAGAEMSPALAEAAQQPNNIELAAELEGLPEFEIPAAIAANRQRDEIDQLLETGPIPPKYEMLLALDTQKKVAAAAAASMQGQVAQNLPPDQTIPTPEEYVQLIKTGAWLDHPVMGPLAKCSLPPTKRDFHQYHLMELKDWWNGPERDKQVEAGNTAGLANLELHWQLHEQFAAKEAQGAQPQAKPPSESMNFKDMPPSGKIQMAAKDGIQLTPQDVIPPLVHPAVAAAPEAGGAPTQGAA